MISVCVATYNGERYIVQQINSILVQLDKNDEIIISDNSSDDKTIALIQSINDDRIKVFMNPKKEGYTFNFENALSKAKGDYIFLADQDDVWVDNKIKKVLPYLHENVLVQSDAYMTDSDLNRTGMLLSDWRRYKKGYLKNLFKGGYVGCTMAFTRSMVAFFLPIPRGVIGHDVWIGLLSELKFKVVYIEEPLIYYRRHNSNTSPAGGKSNNTYLFMLSYRLKFLYFTIKRYLATG